jgi:hypothetical protein
LTIVDYFEGAFVLVGDAGSKHEESLSVDDNPEHALIGHLLLPSLIVHSRDLYRAF